MPENYTQSEHTSLVSDLCPQRPDRQGPFSLVGRVVTTAAAADLLMGDELGKAVRSLSCDLYRVTPGKPRHPLW